MDMHSERKKEGKSAKNNNQVDTSRKKHEAHHRKSDMKECVLMFGIEPEKGIEGISRNCLENRKTIK
jgi:hypothetical protein